MIRSIYEIIPNGQHDSIVTDPLHDRETNRIVSGTPHSIGHTLEEFCGITANAYALAVINDDGLITTYMSDGLKTNHEILFPPAFYDEFRRSRHGTAQPYQQGHQSRNDNVDMDMDMDMDIDMETGPQRRTVTRTAPQYNKCTQKVNSAILGKSPPLLKTTEQLESADAAQKIALGDWDWVNAYYTQCFLNMQQVACRIIGKAWVKLIEPKKQSQYPYRGGSVSAPPWWPLNTVRHKEPDHLRREQRIALLIHIINMVVRQNSNKSDHLKTITVKKLKDAAEVAMTTWFGNKERPSNAEKHDFLWEIVRVAAMEEGHWKSQLGIDSVLFVEEDGTLITSPMPHTAENISAHTPTIATSLLNSNPFFYPSCQNNHCTASTAKHARDDYPVVPFDYPQLPSYDHALSEQRYDNSLPEWQDRSTERQYNLISFRRQQQKSTNVFHAPFYPPPPEQHQQQPMEYSEDDFFGETSGYFRQ